VCFGEHRSTVVVLRVILATSMIHAIIDSESIARESIASVLSHYPCGRRNLGRSFEMKLGRLVPAVTFLLAVCTLIIPTKVKVVI
jgi:hypothetical protein